MNTRDTFPFHEIPDFVRSLRNDLATAGVSFSSAPRIDHVCYRVASVASYEQTKRLLAAKGSLLSEAHINGRPIATFKLHAPVVVDREISIDVVELPAPKSNAFYGEGFEHMEIVIDGSLASFAREYPSLVFATHNINAPINGDISLKLPSGLVKFHTSSLSDVIAAEKTLINQRRKPWALVIDFDETIAFTRAAFLLAIQRALAKTLGRDISGSEIDEKARTTFPEFFANFGVSDTATIGQILECFCQEWPLVADMCSVPEGMSSLLSCLASEGCKVHVWTARDGVTTRDFLDRHHLANHISSVHAFIPGRPSKPVPPEALQDLLVGCNAVYLGDSKTDRLAAHALNIPIVMATWAHTSQSSQPGSASTPMAALTLLMDHFHRGAL